MQRPYTHRLLDRGLIALLLLGFFYNAYRYPFKINAAGTSPTYRDTPPLLSMGKYALVGLVMVYLVLLVAASGQPARIKRPLHTVGYLFLAVVPIAAGVMLRRPDFITLGLFFIVPALLHAFGGWTVSFASLNRALAATVWIALAVEALQLLLFVAVGRLPALAYAGSISVRFGSFLDDPNGYGLLLSWLIPFSAAYFRRWRRVLAVAGLFLTLLLTQSLTALGAFVVAMVVLAIVFVWEFPAYTLPVLVSGIATAIGVGALFFAFQREILAIYELYMLSKEGSLAAHSNALDVFHGLSLPSVLGVQPRVEWWEESGYANLLAYFGAAYVFLYGTLGLLAFWRYLRMYRSKSAPTSQRQFAFGAIGLLLAVGLGNITLPVVSMFPLDLFAALGMGIASADLSAAGEYGAFRRQGAE